MQVRGTMQQGLMWQDGVLYDEIIRDQGVFGLRCKGTQVKILALGKGLPSLEAVITKAEAEEQACAFSFTRSRYGGN